MTGHTIRKEVCHFYASVFRDPGCIRKRNPGFPGKSHGGGGSPDGGWHRGPGVRALRSQHRPV